MEGSPYYINSGAVIFVVARVTLYYSLICFNSDNLVIDYLITLELRQESIWYFYSSIIRYSYSVIFLYSGSTEGQLKRAFNLPSLSIPYPGTTNICIESN